MIFVMAAIIIFSIPGLMLIWSTAYVKSIKKENVRWKLLVSLQLLLIIAGMIVHIYLLRSYGFPMLQTRIETWVSMGFILLICGFMLILNFIITKKLGSQSPTHNSKVVNIITGCFALYFFIILFIAAPLGEKVAFAVSINEAIEAANKTNNEEFSVVLVNSEKDCLRRSSQHCRNQAYKNHYFIKNNMGKKQEVQVKLRALNSNNEEMKVIDSKIMTLKPGELQLLETEETNEDASVWNKYSFQTDGKVYQYQQKIRFRDPD
ncbi:hypothetical protein QNH23_09235 [Siminovitchia fortis]|nr:hypothetical protein [Siminovitchia fortis]WHY83527.1 hypothetical protein QNH23_09235 [Siminovitchia fortis]